MPLTNPNNYVEQGVRHEELSVKNFVPKIIAGARDVADNIHSKDMWLEVWTTIMLFSTILLEFSGHEISVGWGVIIVSLLVTTLIKTMLETFKRYVRRSE